MKNLKQIIFATLLVAIMLTTVVVSVFANTNLSLDELEAIIANIESIGTPEEKESAIRYAMLDIKSAMIDPTEPGYDTLMARFYKQNTDCAMLYIAQFDAYEATDDATADADIKYTILSSAIRLLSSEYARLSEDFDSANKEYFARHIVLFDEYVGIVDASETYEDKGAAIYDVLDYLEKNQSSFTDENYTEIQLAAIDALLVATGDECVELVDLCQGELARIDATVSNKNNPLNQANAKSAILDEAAEIMSNDYAKLSEHYDVGAAALTNISMTLVNDLASVAELTEIPAGVKDEEAFSYLKNAILIDMDQILERGFCQSSEEYDTYLVRRDALNLAVLTEFINMLPTEYTDYDTAQLHKANSAIKQVRNLIKRYFEADQSEELKAQLAVFEGRCELFQAAYDKYIIYRDNRAPLGDYAKPGAIMHFDGTTGLKPTPNGLNSVSGIKEYIDVNGETNTGIYFQPEGLNFYTAFSSSDLYNETGVIFEFDITTFDDEYLANVWFNHGSTTRTSTGESLFPPNFMGILSGGNLHKDYGATSAMILEHAIIPGQWTRIALAFDAKKCTYSIYVDGIIAEEGRDAKITGDITWYLTALRINSINTDGDKSVVMDNFVFYQGSALRTYDRYKDMSDDDKFKIYSDIYSDESQSAPVRLQAYDLGANVLIANYYNTSTGEYLTEDQAIKDIIANKYLLFDYSAVYAEYQEELIFGLKERVDSLETIERGFGTIATRKPALSAVRAYITAAGDYMPQNNTYEIKDQNGEVIDRFSYTSLSGIIEKVEKEIAQDTLFQDFCAKMFRYKRASTITSKQKHYSEAQLIREDPTFESARVYDSVYEKAASGSINLVEAWELYNNAAAEISAMIRADNADVIIKCVNTIKEYDTLEEWEANYDYLEDYVLIMREIIKSGEYDEDLEGFNNAKLFYDSINAYFYSVLQETHVATLTAELDKFPSLVTYIEKLGFQMYIEEYLRTNDIDYNNSEIKEVIDRYEIYKADMGAAEEDYQDVLNQNTKYFVNIVNELQTCVKYEDIKAKLEEGALYLHTMNVGAPEAEVATAIYEEYDARIKRYEEAYKQFAIHTTLISTCVTEDEMFETLVNCNLYRADAAAILDGVDDTDESSEMYVNVRAALAVYDAAYAVYNASISGANLDISAILSLIGTLRDPADIDNVIAVMLTKMGK